MTKIRIDPVTLGLDTLGRVVLSDDILERIEDCPHIVSAGANTGCPPSNTGCTNNPCPGSMNTWCTNLSGCDATMNTFYCRNEVGGG
jgi:hypothetical protein